MDERISVIPRIVRNTHPTPGARAQKGSLDRLPDGGKAVKNFLQIFDEYNKNIGAGSRGLSPKVRAFVDFLVDEIAEPLGRTGGA